MSLWFLASVITFFLILKVYKHDKIDLHDLSIASWGITTIIAVVWPIGAYIVYSYWKNYVRK